MQRTYRFWTYSAKGQGTIPSEWLNTCWILYNQSLSKRYRLYSFCSAIVTFPLSVAYFFSPEVGRDYHIGYFQKILLVSKFVRNTRKIHTASGWQEHLEMASEILKIPPSMKGDIIECGCFKGGSTANLSLVCSLVNRKLVVCDSFEGLPAPDESDKCHYLTHSSRRIEYESGQYKGTLEEVKENITKYGSIKVCEFVLGYFENTLPKLTENFVFVFLDVDLISSLKTCLIEMWPRLQGGCKLFSHEAQDLAFVSLFFDKEWWQNNLKSPPPGFIGAGTGLPLAVRLGCSLGYTFKKRSGGRKNDR